MAVFRLLSTFALLDDDRSLPLGYPQQRTVLAALLVARGQPLSMATLIDRLWDGSPPPTARELLYGHITRLRAILRGYARIIRTAAGYVCEVGPHDVDRYVFDDRIVTFRSSTDSAVQAFALRSALKLWGAEPLGGVPGEWAARTRRAWQQQRIDLLCKSNAAELDRGEHENLIYPLSVLVSEYPTNETLVGQLAVAMHRSGQAGDALGLLRRTRDLLVERQGLDPGPHMQKLEHEILKDIRSPAVSPALSGRDALPPDLAGFVGRSATIAVLSAASATVTPGAVSLVLLSGSAGVGKTTTAVHWAHQAAQEFPGGRYYVDLGGFRPARDLLSPAEAAGILLTTIGVPADRVPNNGAERVALLNAAGAGRRLIILDGAARSDHIVPMLSGLPGTLVVVVSRFVMPELVIAHAATAVHLDPLSHEEGCEVLMRRLAHRHPGAATVDRIVRACGCLPLALALVAGRAAAEPGIPLRQLADELERPGRRLDVLDVDGIPGLRAALDSSLQYLSPAARNAFVLLSAAPGREFSEAAAASFLALDVPTASTLIAELGRLNLLCQAGRGRYFFHELVRLFAEEQAYVEPMEARMRDTA